MLAFVLLPVLYVTFAGTAVHGQEAVNATLVLQSQSAPVSIVAGGTIVAPDGEQAVVGLGDAAQLKLEPGSVLKFESGTQRIIGVGAASPSASGCLRSRFVLSKGRARVNVNASGNTFVDLEVAGPGATVVVRGGILAVTVGARGETLVSVERGRAEVRAQGDTVLVSAGEETTVTPGAKPVPALPWSETEETWWQRQG